ncbi:MAG: hypothetical protein KDK64_06850, partial [Chlamydiia bacterium]|nr:hypothetical protein [Chlamydiia bacterium]
EHDKIWQEWNNNNLPINSQAYILTARASNCSGRLMGVFVNVPNMIYILSLNHKLFEKETGVSFDPKFIVEEIGSNTSEFWNSVFENHYLLGILLGYGEKNSFIFNWKVEASMDFQELPFERKNEDCEKSGVVRYKRKVNTRDLPLPQFVYFGIYDEEIEKYKRERDLIVIEFEGKKFKSKVLEYLTH